MFYGSQFGSVLLDLGWDKGKGTAQFVIFVEEAIGVAHGVKAWIKGDGDVRLVTTGFVLKKVVEGDAGLTPLYFVLMG